MQQMKDSGIKWIGQIPDNWEVKRCKMVSKFTNGYAFEGSDLKASDFCFPVIRIGDIQNDTVSYCDCQGVDNNKGLENYKIKKDDILLAMSGATVGKVGYVSEISQSSYINQRVGIIRTSFPRFLFYTLKTPQFMDYINLMSNGSAQPNVSDIVFGNYPIAYPNLKQQQRIADFLDKKCAEIDEIIAKKESQITAIENYKKSLITETVTKGLDKNIKLKDSGVKWIGQIPEGWNIKKIKYVASLKGRIGWQGLTSDEYQDEGPYLITGIDFENGQINWESCVHISEERWAEAIDVPRYKDDGRV